MTCPPKKDSDAMTKYASTYVSLFPPTPRRALQIAIEEFEKKKFDKIPERKWMTEADVELRGDMWSLMRHPAFMFDRRRFVVLYSQWESTPVHREGVCVQKFGLEAVLTITQRLSGRQRRHLISWMISSPNRADNLAASVVHIGALAYTIFHRYLHHLTPNP